MSTDATAPAADLTAPARTRNAALAQFTAPGSTPTTIRNVAAGVSASLVQHHFGTNDGLSEAYDAYMAEHLHAQVAQSVTTQGTSGRA